MFPKGTNYTGTDGGYVFVKKGLNFRFVDRISGGFIQGVTLSVAGWGTSVSDANGCTHIPVSPSPGAVSISHSNYNTAEINMSGYNSTHTITGGFGLQPIGAPAPTPTPTATPKEL